MPDLFIYLLKLSIVTAGIYVFYFTLLRKEKLFTFNRAYLLIAILLSLIIPLISLELPGIFIPTGRFHNLIIPVNPGPEAAGINTEEPVNSRSITYYVIFLATGGYFTIGFILFLRLIYGCFKVFRIIANSHKRELLGQEVYLTEDDLPPFSFFNKVVLPKNIISSPDLQVILDHEKAHVNGWHTIDILIAEFLLISQWFSPVARLLKNAIRINLEYSADQYVLKKYPDLESYQLAMVRLADKRPAPSIVNALQISQLKKRIIMMKKENIIRYPVLRRLAILPLSLILVIFVSGKMQINPVQDDEFLIKGNVTASNNRKPLESAIIQIEGSAEGTITDRNGHYVIRVNRNDKELVFSSDGYKTKVVEIGNNKTIDVVLKKLNNEEFKNQLQKTYSDSSIAVTVKMDSITGTLRFEFIKPKAPAGELMIRGKVISAGNGSPIGSANVIVKGTRSGTISDQDGNYLIKVNKDNKALLFVSPGHKSKEVNIDKELDINKDIDVDIPLELNVELDPED